LKLSHEVSVLVDADQSVALLLVVLLGLLASLFLDFASFVLLLLGLLNLGRILFFRH